MCVAGGGQHVAREAHTAGRPVCMHLLLGWGATRALFKYRAVLVVGHSLPQGAGEGKKHRYQCGPLSLEFGRGAQQQQQQQQAAGVAGAAGVRARGGVPGAAPGGGKARLGAGLCFPDDPCVPAPAWGCLCRGGPACVSKRGRGALAAQSLVPRSFDPGPRGVAEVGAAARPSTTHLDVRVCVCVCAPVLCVLPRDEEAGGPEGRYTKAYEARLNPFAEFQQKEQESRVRSLPSTQRRSRASAPRHTWPSQPGQVHARVACLCTARRLTCPVAGLRPRRGIQTDANPAHTRRCACAGVGPLQVRALQLHDRAVLAGSKLLVGSRFGRLFLAVYALLLHAFIMVRCGSAAGGAGGALEGFS